MSNPSLNGGFIQNAIVYVVSAGTRFAFWSHGDTNKETKGGDQTDFPPLAPELAVYLQLYSAL